MTAEEAEAYHAEQIGTFAGTAADLVTAITMTYVDEAVGVVRAARAAGLPVVISFTVETDGCLPSGQSLRAAIDRLAKDKNFELVQLHKWKPIDPDALFEEFLDLVGRPQRRYTLPSREFA